MTEIRKSRKAGGSIIIPLTGFIEPDKYYDITKEKDGSIVIREAEINIKK